MARVISTFSPGVARLRSYEIVEGDASVDQEFHGMDMEVLRKGLAVLTKQGKAQVFGTDDQQGVKFF